MSRAARQPNGLTIREEKFCREYFEIGIGGDAYRKAYTVDPAKDGKWVEVEASKLLGRPEAQAYLNKLRGKSEQIAAYSADNAMQEAKEAFDLAKKIESPAAMVSAVTLRAKLAGHLVDKKEIGHKTLKEAPEEELLELLRASAKEAGLVIEKAKEGDRNGNS